MFNSSYGGIESDGMYHQMQKEQQHPQSRNDLEDAETFKTFKPEKKRLFGSSFFKNIETDDLILLGIALLLLLDGDGDNDIFVFIIAAIIFMS